MEKIATLVKAALTISRLSRAESAQNFFMNNKIAPHFRKELLVLIEILIKLSGL